ncbi:MAG: cob(I)yrinic acid a,c-diamide adenosyltransferase [Anaerolineae bacterium]|jgi:cob(I)alamin adenosyltransferase|nr:cob(I)yrinic acid a,c-diamide adenosyltransferase [Anaerolineae bacterium]
MRIYTRTGDDGTTSLFAGGRVSKSSLRVDTYGTVDELNSMIGLARAHGPTAQTDHYLEWVQNQLFRLGSDLATPLEAKADWLVRINVEAVTWLEQTIDQMTDALPELKDFILPGGSLVSAHLQVARTVCRRAERLVVSLAESDEPINDHARMYLNRLSDWLFTLARWENHQVGVKEHIWTLKS